MYGAPRRQVEATVSQVSLWVVGTAVGGTLGYLAMLDPDLATNPYGLMAIICTYTFLVGCASSSAYRMGIVFTLMAMASLILCQVRGGVWGVGSGGGAAGSGRLQSARRNTSIVLLAGALAWECFLVCFKALLSLTPFDVPMSAHARMHTCSTAAAAMPPGVSR